MGAVETVGTRLLAEGADKFVRDMKAAEVAYDSAVGRFRSSQGTFVSTNSVLTRFLGSLSQAQGGLVSTAEGVDETARASGGLNLSLAALAAGVGAAFGLIVTAGRAVTTVIRGISDVVGAATRAVAGFLGESIMLAGRWQEMEYSALAIGRAMGFTEEAIRGNVEALREAGIRYDVANMVTAQMIRNQIDLANSFDLARIAQATGIIVGEDSSETMQRLVWAITTHNTFQLRRMGIMVDLTAAEERHAQALGRTRDELTEVQLVQADVNAVIEASANLMGVYEAAMESATKQLRTLRQREIPELMFAVGEPFQVAFATVVGTIRRLVEALRQALSEGGALYPILVQLGAAANLLAQGFESAVDRVLGLFSDMSNDINTQMGATAEALFGWGVEMVTALAEGIIRAAASVLSTAMNVISSVLAFWLAPGSPPRVAPRINEWGAATMAEYLRGFGEAQFDVLRSVQGVLKKLLTGEDFKRISMELIRGISVGLDPAFFSDLARSVGRFGGEVADLVRRQLELARATDAVTEAEMRLEQARRRVQRAQTEVSKQTAEYNRLLRGGADRAILDAQLARVNAAEQALTLAEEQAAAQEQAVQDAQDELDPLRERARLQERLVDQLVELFNVAQQVRGGGGAGGGAGRGAGLIPDLLGEMPDPADWNISARIQEVIAEATKALRERLQDLFAPVKALYEDMLVLMDDLQDRWDKMTNMLRRVWLYFVSDVYSPTKKLLDLFGGLLDLLGAFATVIYTTFDEAVRYLVDEQLRTIIGGFAQIVGLVNDLLGLLSRLASFGFNIGGVGINANFPQFGINFGAGGAGGIDVSQLPSWFQQVLAGDGGFSWPSWFTPTTIPTTTPTTPAGGDGGGSGATVRVGPVTVQQPLDLAVLEGVMVRAVTRAVG